VLDLGCGPANASAFMREAGLVPDPVDASAGMVRLANERYGIGARLATFDDIGGVAEYDGVWANFSLLHAARGDLPRYIAALHRALKPGGIFHIGMKTGTGEARDGIDRLYTYVGRDELTGLLTDAGFTVTDTTEGTEVGLAGTNDPFIICRAHA
jgi:SAM-dependent methyltransferase